MPNLAPAGRPPLILHALGRLYARLFEVAETILRVVARGVLVTHRRPGGDRLLHWIVQAEGWFGAEKSVIWATVVLYFMIRGANSQTVDARIGRQF